MPDPWVVAVVDDEEQIRKDVADYLEGEKFDFGTFNVFKAEHYEAALPALKQQKIDLVVLDLFKGSPKEGQDFGRPFLETWKETGFAPVIVFSASPGELQSNAFVRVVTKDGGGVGALRPEIEWLFATKIPQIHRAIVTHMDEALRTYMWGFVTDQWGQFEPLLKQADFVRLLVKRLALNLSRDGVTELVRSVYGKDSEKDLAAEKVHPSEFYIKPPLAKTPRLGDLRYVDEGKPEKLYVVLWPSCDFVIRDGKCKAETVLCAGLAPVSEQKEVTKLKEGGKLVGREKKEAVERLLKNTREGGQPERFHFLPAAWDIPASVVDFQDLRSVSVTRLRESKIVATLASPFAEELSNRFLRYLGRIGTPDLDFAGLVEAMVGG